MLRVVRATDDDVLESRVRVDVELLGNGCRERVSGCRVGEEEGTHP